MVPQQLTDSKFGAPGLTGGATNENPEVTAVLNENDEFQAIQTTNVLPDGGAPAVCPAGSAANSGAARRSKNVPSDDDLVLLAGNAPTGHRFLSLWGGNATDHESDREALTELAFYFAAHTRDTEQLHRLVGQCPLAKTASWWSEREPMTAERPDRLEKGMYVICDALRRHYDGTGPRGTDLPRPRSGPNAEADPMFTPSIESLSSATGLTDDEVISATLANDHNGLLRLALKGDPTRFPDIQRAREGLCTAIARHCTHDAAQICRIVHQSNIRPTPGPHGPVDFDILGVVRTGIRNAKQGAGDIDMGWEVPLPFSSAPTVPLFPVDCLPDWLRNFVEELSTALQVPADLVAVQALATVGAALARKFVVVPRPGWHEPLNLFACCIAAVGERKSAVHRAIVKHIHDFEAKANVQLSGELNAVHAQRDFLASKLDGLKSQAKKAKGENGHDLQAELIQLRKQINELPDLHPVRLTAGDVTQESLMKLLAEQSGRMFQVSPEGGPFEVMKGRYSERENFDVYLHGHAGDDLTIDRITREENKVRHPALSVALMVQPDVIRGIVDNPAAAGRGLLARFLYAWPSSRVGSRQVATPAAKDVTIATFNKLMTWLWSYGANGKDYTPKPLAFSPEADKLLQDFEKWLEPRLAEGGEYGWMAGWGNKLAGHAARIAGGLHCCALAASSIAQETSGLIAPFSPALGTVSPETAGRAIRLAKEYFLPHAQATLGVMGADKRVEKGRRVIEEIRAKWKSPRIKPSDVMRISGRAFGSAEEAEKVLQLLASHHYMRAVQEDGRAIGKAYKRPDYLLNPLAFPLT